MRQAWLRCLSLRWMLVALGAAGCTPIVKADFPSIVITRADIAVPSAASSGLSAVTFSFSFDSSQLGASTNPENQNGITSVTLHKLVLTAQDGITDLSFVDTLHILAFVPIVSKTSSHIPSLHQVEVADYQRRAGSATGPVFSVPLPEPVDLLPLLRPSSTEQRKIEVLFNLGGSLPTKAWTVDISMSLSVGLEN